MKEILLLITSFSFISSTFCIQCVDHNNNPIDWYILYKLPYMKSANANKFIRSGFAYTFMQSDFVNPWKLSTVSIGSINSILALSLEPLYVTNVTDLLYILYNDEPPNKHINDNKGHTKGVIIGNEDGGLWLVHSVPKFPPRPEDGSYTYPLTGSVYGQSFLCISLDSDNLNNLGKQLLYNQLNMYSHNMPTALSSKYPYLVEVINSQTINDPPWFSQLNITSKAGMDFVTFAKTKDFNRDLYKDWVTPMLESDFFVETWPNGVGRLPSTCGNPFNTLNVKSIIMQTPDVNVNFSSTHDHSKWAVSSDKDKYWLCIGDINRATTQLHRGGGTVCIFNKLVSSSYKLNVNTTEPCP